MSELGDGIWPTPIPPGAVNLANNAELVEERAGDELMIKVLRDALTSESKDYLHLDALRFAASAGVVVFHYSAFARPAETSPGSLIASFHLFVDLFFLISGFVIASVYAGRVGTTDQVVRFLRARIARLAPLHWATLGFFIAVAGIKTAIGWPIDPSIDWSCVAPNALGLHSLGTCSDLSFNAPSWSISAELAMYLALPLLIALPRWGLACAFFTSIAALTAAVLMFDLIPWSDWTFAGGAARALPAFTLGVMLSKSGDLLRRVPMASTLTWVSLSAFGLLAFVGASSSVLLATIYAVGVFAMAADMQGRSSRVALAVAPLGQLTYSVYMLHMPLALVVISVGGAKILGLDGVTLTPIIFLCGLLLIPVATLSLALFEKPARAWINGRRKQPRLAAAPAQL